MKNEKLAALVIEAQKGNQKALSDLIESCYNDIYYFALKTVKKEDVAADITQDACLKIIQSLGKLNEPMAFKSWALRITYNLCSTHFSTPQDVLVEENEDGETVFDTIADDSEDAQPDKAYENAEFKQMMRDMIESLPAEQASALMLYYYEKVSVKEIAEIHGVSEGTVKSRLNYGRKAVKEKVEDYEKRTGIRLHSITPLPLLLAWFFAQSAEKMPAVAAATLSSSVAAAGATAAGVSTAAGATAATTAGAAAATVAAKAGVSALAAKVIAIVVGASLAVSAAVGGIYIATNNSDTEITEEDDNDGGENYGDNDGENYGDNGDENNGENNGENSGENGGSTAPAHTHTYENGFCTVCGEAKPSEGLEFTLNDDGESYSVTGIGACTDTDIVIPSTYEGKPVTGIGEYAFAGCKTLKSVTIPNGVTSIGNDAFSYCYALTSINIPDSVTIIGNNAFYYCSSLTNVSIPNSVTSIGNYAFLGCTSLATITIPNSVTSIGRSAFSYCTSLTSITIPDSVTSIGENAFRECTSLATITIPNSVTSIGENAFLECTSLATITIPNSVTSIGYCAFADCTSLTGITIPFVGEKKDGTGDTDFDYIFGGTAPASLKTVTITGGSSIADNAFSHCGSITSITIPDSVTSIGEFAFSYCGSITSITIPDSVTSIGDDAFRECTSLASVTIGNSVTSIGDMGFVYCQSLTSISIPDSVTSIGYMGFAYCQSLTSITFNGTKAQWADIEKGNSWNDVTPDYTVHCTDGDITK